MPTISPTLLASLQQDWKNQYIALTQANNAAGKQVKLLEGLGDVSDQNTKGNFTPSQLQAYDQAKLQHLNAHAQLTAFLRDTNLNYSREAGRLNLVAATATNPQERDQANLGSQILASEAAEFSAFKSAQGWTLPNAIGYQVGSKTIVSNAGGQMVTASPTGVIDGIAESIRQWISSINAAGTDNAQALKDQGVELTDMQACLAVMDKIKSSVLKNFLPAPEVFKGGPGIPLDPTNPLNPLNWENKTIGERLWSKGVGSSYKVDGAFCKFIVGKQDILELMQELGQADAAFLAQLDAFTGDIALSVSRQVADQALAIDKGLDGITSTTSLSQFDAQVQAATAQMSTVAGFNSVAMDQFKDWALDALDGAPTDLGLLQRTADDQVQISDQVGGQNVIFLASLDLGTASDAGNGLQFTQIQSVNGQTPTDAAGLNATLNASDVNARDILLGRGADALNQIVTTAVADTPTPTTPTLDANSVSAWISLMQALKAGQPLPIVSSAINLARTFDSSASVPLSGAAGAVGGLASLSALQKALQNNDFFGTVNASAQLITNVASLYAAANGKTLADALSGTEIFGAATGFMQGVTQALPFLNIAYAVLHGDDRGALIGVAYAINPFVGLAASIISYLDSSEEVLPQGAGTLVHNPDGSIGLSVSGLRGGDTVVRNTLADIQAGLQQLLAQAPGAVIAPDRFGMLVYGNRAGEFRYTDAHYQSGRYFPDISGDPVFNNQGQRINAPVGSDEYFRGLAEEMLTSALAQGVVTTPWEAQTAAQQQANYSLYMKQFEAFIYGEQPAPPTPTFNPPISGVTEVQGVAALNKLATPGAAPTFKPIILDLNGDNQINLQGVRNVAFDVDATGYLRNTDWTARNASGQVDGFLVLDRNQNGLADTGEDLFSNAQVASDLQGVASLQWVDANNDGKIDKSDPVFNQLSVWRDTNGNGRVDAGEAVRIADLGEHGIAFNYRPDANGYASFVMDGQSHVMASPQLNVDSTGTNLSAVTDANKRDITGDGGKPVGIYVLGSDGSRQLQVNAFQTDAATGHKKVVGALEDFQVGIRVSDLDPSGSLNGSGFRNVQGGTTSLTGQVLTFIPTPNYNGLAGFTYTRTDGSQITVDIPITAVNDAPQILGAGNLQGVIYGYAKASNVAGQAQYWMPIFTPGSRGYGQDGVYSLSLTQPLKDGNGNVLTGVDFFHGKFITSDVDGGAPIFGANAVTGQPHQGSVAVTADGTWNYAPNGFVSGLDAFRVQATDSQGATGSTVVMVTLPASAPAQNNQIVSFTRGPNGAPTIDYTQYRSQFIRGMSDADLGIQGQRTYDYSPDGKTLTVAIFDNVGQIASETVVIDIIAGTITDTLNIPMGSITAVTNALTGTQTDQWQLTNGSGRAGSNTYNADGTSTHSQSVNGVPVVTPAPPPPTPTPAPTAPPAAAIPAAPTPAQVLSDAITTFTKNNTQVTFQIKPDGSTTLSYKNPDGSVNAYDARPDGSYVASQTRPDGSNGYVAYAPATGLSSNGANVVQQQLPGSAGAGAYNFGQGVSVVQNADGSSQYQMALVGGSTMSLSVDSAGRTHFTVRDAANKVISVASTSYNANGQYVFVDETPPPPPAPTPAPASPPGASPSPPPDPVAYNNGSISFTPDELATVKAYFDTAPSDAQIAQSAVNLHLTTLQLATLLNWYANTTRYTASGIQQLVNTELSSQYHVAGNGVIVANPIVFDLDGNGIDLIALSQSTVMFDMAGNGQKVRTAWIGPNDGFLAYDENGDGKIDRRQELVFSDFLTSARTDLEGLAALDTNHDGVFNASDPGWAKAGIWVDRNQDGITDAGEFKSLGDMGIASLSLASDHRFQLLADNVLHGTTTFTRTDGRTGVAADVGLAYEAPAGFAAVGSPATDVLAGTERNDLLDGGAGDDVLIGNAGNDLLDGGQGSDLMFGGSGNDIYVVDGASDSVFEKPGEGYDTVRSSVNYTLADSVEALELTGNADITATGNSLDNKLVGNDGRNVLSGGAGNDTLIAGAGVANLAGGADNDTYVVNNTQDLVIENAGEGIDQVLASVNFTLADNVENLTLMGTATSGTGNDLANIITANNLGDLLQGGGGDDILLGGTGSDTLDGGTGADLMMGAAGDDAYVVDNADDAVKEKAGEGTDTVLASVSHALTDSVENLVLTGAGDISGIGNALNNTLLGNSGDNLLDGGAGVDWMSGGKGNDTYVVDSADVVVEQGGEGVDTVLASVNHTLAANVENLALTGSAGINGAGNELDNQLMGNSGNNRLDGRAGADDMRGGAGDDIYTVDNTGDRVTEDAGAGTDTVLASVTYALAANVENITLTGSADIDARGNELANTLIGNSGVNKLEGGLGNDLYIVDDSSDTVVERAGEGTDQVNASISYTLTANVENLTLTGTAAITGTGNELANTLIGNAANNTLDGGAGADTLKGGQGNDTYLVDNIADTLVEAADEGVDTVRSSVTYTLAANLENIVLTGDVNTDATGNELGNELTGNSGVNKLAGGKGDDIYNIGDSRDTVLENAAEGTDLVRASITYALTANVEQLLLTGADAINGIANALDNVLVGNAAANTLTGLDGNDVLDGGAGADRLVGGKGDDLYVVDNTGDTVVESAAEGTDQVNAGITYTLAANLETLVLTGTGNIDGTGNTQGNLLVGNDGNNRLDGVAGADRLQGGKGDDTYVVDNAGDVVVENANEGTDQVLASVTTMLSANVENLTLTGTAAVSGTGNALDNLLTGNAAANTLTGGAGRDTLDGAAGADRLLGGADDDTYVVDNRGDVVVESANEGVDLVRASVSYTLADNVENLTLTGTNDIDATGNALDNVLTGNSGRNKLTGGKGNDIYIINNSSDQIMEKAGEGTDLVQSHVSYTLADNVENLTLTGMAALSGDGNDLANILIANHAGNQLDGDGGNDSLVGGDGADLLDGGSGIDVMAGGKGDDTYVVDNVADTVTENADEGRDTVSSSVTWTLGAHQENLTLTGNATINGTGNELDNSLIGNSKANTLSGGDGADWIDGGDGADFLVGGRGDDNYVVDDSRDVVQESAGEGLDTVHASASFTLGANVERLELTGDAGIAGTGNALDNLIVGNSGNNALSSMDGDDELDGRAGRDTMTGGRGDDLYWVDNMGDTVVEKAGEGVDTVNTSVSGVLYANVENVNLLGTADLQATGNALVNVMTGNSGANRLDGGAGADRLVGGAGDDSYGVDNALDVVVEEAGEGTDTVMAIVDFQLSDNVENLTLLGGALKGSGNAGANTIMGTDAANWLDGGAGADRLVGGYGDDTYVVDNGADVVVEAVEGGTDTVRASASYTLSAFVENITLTGTANINATGNDLANVLEGNAGVNRLAGGQRDDTYIVNNSADTVVELAGEGNDTVRSSVSFVLSANVENLYLTGKGDIAATGNGDANVLIGNGGANAIDGGAGDDTLLVSWDTNWYQGATAVNVGSQTSAGCGMHANAQGLVRSLDTYEGGTGTDTLLGTSRGDGIALDDGVQRLKNIEVINVGDGDDIVDLTSTRYTYGDVLIKGGAGDDVLWANAGRDVLQGGIGSDVLDGAGGSNLLDGGDGADRIADGDGASFIAGGRGNDEIYSGAGADLLAFNRGDGADEIDLGAGAGDTVSRCR